MSPPVEAVDTAFRTFDLVGVFANAVLGGVLARQAKLDLVGFGVLAVLSGLGGGVIRDTLLQVGPPAALRDDAYIVTALAGAVVAYLLDVRGRIWDKTFPLLDALALGCWSAAGAQKTLEAGLGWLPAVLLGVVTAVGGGTVRDVVLRRTPGVFTGPLYATSALVASAVMVGLDLLGHGTVGLVAATMVGAGLTLVARWRGWLLPQPRGWRPASALIGYSQQLRRSRQDGPAAPKDHTPAEDS